MKPKKKETVEYKTLVAFFGCKFRLLQCPANGFWNYSTLTNIVSLNCACYMNLFKCLCKWSEHSLQTLLLTLAACDFSNTSTQLLWEPLVPVLWWHGGLKKPHRVCLYSPTAVALLECAKQVGKLQLHSLIFFLLVRRRRGKGGRGFWGGGACLPLVEWNPRIVRDHTGSWGGEGSEPSKMANHSHSPSAAGISPGTESLGV